MNRIKFFVLLALTVCLTLLFNTHQPFGLPLPALGDLFDPFQGFWQNAEPTTPEISEELDMKLLQDRVEVVYDDRMVPHIFAATAHDAMFVQGYLLAKYRLWQMDITTRAIAGRLSEVLGEVTLERDRIMRRKGLLFAAENAVKSWEDSGVDMKYVQAFSDGINAYVEDLAPADFPIEFKLLGYEPEPWSPLKTALVYKSMAYTLCSRNNDLEATNTLNILGQERFDFLFPEYNPKQTPVIPAGVEWEFDSIPAPGSLEEVKPIMIGEVHPFFPTLQPSPHAGSNNWAISKKKSASGHPILCNDPHLDLTLPSIWFEQQIQFPGCNAYGVTVPGLPGTVIGFNEASAWGITNVGQDVLDWYQIQWADDSKEHYLLDGVKKPVEKVVELIYIRGKKEPLRDTVKYTRWGPVVYESEEAPYQDLAMRWLAHDQQVGKPFYEIGTIINQMQSENVEEYQEALKGATTPALNMLYANKQGDIALTVNGKFPVKRKGQGRTIQEGNNSDNAWKGFIPYQEIPKAVNPQQGYLSSANQHSTDPSYPYYYNGGFEDYRGRMVNRLLSGPEKLTVEDMKRFQNSTYSIKAEESLPLLLKLISGKDLEGSSQEMYDLLVQWDYHFTPTAKAPIVYEEWFDELYRLAFDEFYQLKDSTAILFPEDWRFISLMHQNPDDPIFDDQDTSEKETLEDLAIASFNTVSGNFHDKIFKEDLDWAAHKGNPFRHIGRIDAFSVRDIRLGGNEGVLNCIRGDDGPSWRMIVELAENPNALGVYPGGQSGNPGSAYYDLMVDSWANGEYYPLYLMSDSRERLPEELGRQLLY